MNSLVLILAASVTVAAAYPTLQGFEGLVMNRKNGRLQQWPPQCSPFEFRVRINNGAYVFKYCQANGMGCLDQSSALNTPSQCNAGNHYIGCYKLTWSANGRQYDFDMCPTFDGACVRYLSLMRCMRRGGDVRVEGIRLCEELPDGTEDCENIPADEGQAQQLDDEECFCVSSGGRKYCEPSGCDDKL